MAIENELDKDNIRETHWIGEVVDNADPANLGRCRVKVFGKFDDLPKDAIPWATPMTRDHVGSHHIPNIGTIVAVRFDNGNIYHPEYWFQINQDKNLKADLLDTSAEPHNVVSLVYDASRNIRIYHSPEDGLIITNGSSKDAQPMIRFSKDGKLFLNADNIYIASNKADENQPAVRGQVLQDILDSIIEDIKMHTHPSSGAPMSPTTSISLSITQKKLKTIKQVKQ
jgi:hypothetical protein